jgi:hypothetical protein
MVVKPGRVMGQEGRDTPGKVPTNLPRKITRGN